MAAETISANPGAFLGVETSLAGQAWRLRVADEAQVRDIARMARVSDLVARVLAARGVAPDAAARHLDPRLRDFFPDPSSFQDMDLAAAKIWDAVEAGRSISVFADYDVDGGTSAAQLIRWFRQIGVDAGLYVPDRINEGYGPSPEAFETLKARGTDFVITVDCGATAGAALDAARDLGLGVVVVDHHLMGADLPVADAVVNPNRLDCQSGQGHLAAAGVVFVLLAALNREGRRRGGFEGRNEPDILALADLAALGTVCDVVALSGFNRSVVTQGLKVMGGWANPGLRALAEVSGVKTAPGVYHAGFLLGPRINAGGRVGRSDLGARLLSTDDFDEAREIAAELDRLNAERKAIEAEVIEAATAQIERSGHNAGPVLVCDGPGWHPGVIGIAAGRIKDRYGRPAVVIGVENGVGKGSGRSVPGVDLGRAVSDAKAEGLLVAGGGHPMAAGLTIEEGRIADFTEFLNARLAADFDKATDARALKLDGLMSPAGATQAFVEELQRAGPFGQGYSEPRFAIGPVRVAYAERVGGAHVRFALAGESGDRVSGVAFRSADTPIGEALLGGERQRWYAAGRIKLDEWRGRKRVEFHLEDLAATE